ncbi:SAM-dependent methyltransferase [Actinomadura sp. 21ATH]|uniref:SAM-dependent methyltransferase n=1 Tax=Actinomadura sp. 21ATH TaxID=1735444 RepID=UPI0035BEFE63
MARRFDEPSEVPPVVPDGAPFDVREALEHTMRRPSTARMYDVFLGGKDNYAEDRDAAEAVEKVAPSIPRAARDNRAFMARAVAWCAQQGIEQIIDLGTGFPTEPNALDTARRFMPDAVVVGVDHDPVVLAHAQGPAGMSVLPGDIRDPGAVIAGLSEWIEWEEPVAVLMVAVLHFIADEEDPAGIVAAFAERLVPGSAVVISHVCSTGADPSTVAEVERVYAGSTSPGSRFRTHEEITALFGGLHLVPPGVVQVQHWPIERGPVTDLPVLGGIGTVPARRRRRRRPR